jgi:hypothetical protein
MKGFRGSCCGRSASRDPRHDRACARAHLVVAGGGGVGARDKRERRRADLPTAILLAPTCLLFALFVIYPIGASIRLSLRIGTVSGPWLVGSTTFANSSAIRCSARHSTTSAGLPYLVLLGGQASPSLPRRCSGCVVPLFFLRCNQPGDHRLISAGSSTRASVAEPDSRRAACRQSRRSTAKLGALSDDLAGL